MIENKIIDCMCDNQGKQGDKNSNIANATIARVQDNSDNKYNEIWKITQNKYPSCE